MRSREGFHRKTRAQPQIGDAAGDPHHQSVIPPRQRGIAPGGGLWQASAMAPHDHHDHDHHDRDHHDHDDHGHDDHGHDDHAHDAHAAHGHSHHHAPAQMDAAFAIGAGVNLAFVAAEVV